MSKQKVLCCVEQMVLKKSAVLVVQETNLVKIKLLPVTKAISVSTYKHLFGFIYETSLSVTFKFVMNAFPLLSSFVSLNSYHVLAFQLFNWQKFVLVTESIYPVVDFL